MPGGRLPLADAAADCRFHRASPIGRGGPSWMACAELSMGRVIGRVGGNGDESLTTV
jgi:hypothetical protein